MPDSIEIISPASSIGPRRLLVVAGALIVAAGGAACDKSTAPVPVPAAVKAEVNDTQSVQVGVELSAPLSVKVLDASGQPVVGTLVTFSSTGGGAFGESSVTTNDSGLAVTAFTAGTVAGTDTITARDSSATPAVLYVTAMAGPPTLITATSGDQQTGAAGSTLPQPLVVKATDQFGNAVAGAAVTWTTTGAGSFGAPSGVTGTNGLIQTTFTLDAAAGAQTVTAAIAAASLAVTFTETGT